MATAALVVSAGAAIYGANRADKAAKRQQAALNASQMRAEDRMDKAEQEAIIHYGTALSTLDLTEDRVVDALVNGQLSTQAFLSDFTGFADEMLEQGQEQYVQDINRGRNMAEHGLNEAKARSLNELYSLERKSKADLNRAADAGEQKLMSDMGRARSDLQQGRGQALSELRRGFGRGRDELGVAEQQFRKDLIDSESAALDAAELGVNQARAETRRGQDMGLRSLLDADRTAVDRLQSGQDRSLAAVREGTDQARADLRVTYDDQARQSQLRNIQTGREFDNLGNVLQDSYDQQIQFSDEGYGQARDDLRGALASARGIRASTGALDAYDEAGKKALEREMAFSGASGAEAQQAAYDEYMESPAQKFARERQEQSLLRNASAIGGLQGGNVRTALQEQARGIASQNLQQDIANLQALSSRGQQAASTASGLRSSAAMARGQTSAQIQSQMADIARQSGLSKMQLQQTLGSNLANLEQRRFETQQNRLDQQNAMQRDTANRLSNLANQRGMTEAQLISQSQGNMANLASQLGVNENQLIQATQGNLSNLANQLGMTEAQLIQQTGGQLSSGAERFGTNRANMAAQEGQLASGINQQSAMQMANYMAQQGMTRNQIEQALGVNLSNISSTAGQLRAQTHTRAGEQKSMLRSQAGRDIATNNMNVAGQRADLQSNLGRALAQNQDQHSTNLANMIAGFGRDKAANRTNLAATKANIAGGQASNIMQGSQALANASGLREMASANKTTTMIDQLTQLLGNQDIQGLFGGGQSTVAPSQMPTGTSGISQQQFNAGAQEFGGNMFSGLRGGY